MHVVLVQLYKKVVGGKYSKFLFFLQNSSSRDSLTDSRTLVCHKVEQ